MNNFESRFEIIEDEPPKPKRKQRPQYPFSLRYLPWRLLLIVLMAGLTIGIAIVFLLTRNPQVLGLPDSMSDASDPTAVSKPPYDVAFSDSVWSAVSASDKVLIYKDNVLFQTLDTPNAHIAFSADGSYLAALAKDTNLLQIWSTQEGDLVSQANMPSAWDSRGFFQRGSMTFSADNNLLVLGMTGGILVLDTHTLEHRVEITNEPLGSSMVTISPDNKRISTISQYYVYDTNRYPTFAKVWDIQNPSAPQIIYSLPIPDAYAQDAALTLDGHYLAYISRDDSTSRPIEVMHIQDLVAQRSLLTLPSEPDTHIGQFALTDSYVAFQQRTTDSSGDENSLQIARWTPNGDQTDYQPFAQPLPLGPLGVNHLRLWSQNGAVGLDYMSLDTNRFFNWDFGSNSIRSVSY